MRDLIDKVEPVTPSTNLTEILLQYAALNKEHRTLKHLYTALSNGQALKTYKEQLKAKDKRIARLEEDVKRKDHLMHEVNAAAQVLLAKNDTLRVQLRISASDLDDAHRKYTVLVREWNQANRAPSPPHLEAV